MNMLATLLNIDEKKVSSNSVIKGWRDTEPYNTGLNISATEIHSICPGVIYFVGRDEDDSEYYVVDVLVNDNQLIRYCHLKSVTVEEGSSITTGEYLGETSKYIRLEYCTLAESRWPVRVYGSVYYKHDPSGLLDNSLQLDVYVQGDIDEKSIYIGETQDLDELASYGPDPG